MSTENSSLSYRVLALAAPVLAEQILAVGVGLVDTWLTGNFLPGDKYLAAIGQIAYLMWLIPCLFTFVSIGTTALVARSVGAGDGTTANRAANQSLTLGFILAVAVTLWLWLGSTQLIAWLRLPREAAELADVYLKYIVPVVPAIMFERVSIAALQGAGDTVSGMVVRVIVNIANVLLSMALVLGWGPLPTLGWRGIALGTAISHAIGGGILLLLLLRGRAGLKLRAHMLPIDVQLAIRILRIGIPGGMDVLLILVCHLWYVSLINSMGTAQAAAHSLAIRIESLAYLPGAAFQVAATTLAGQFLGAQQPRQASRSVLLALLMGGGVMVSAGLVMFFLGSPLTEFFGGSGNSETSYQAARLLKIVAYAMPFLATAMIVSGALRGAGDTRWPMAINVIGMACIRIPGTYLVLGVLNEWILRMGDDAFATLRGAWYVVLLELCIRAGLVLLRFRHGGWKETAV